MNRSLRLITPPGEPLLNVVEVRAHLAIDGEQDDAFLTSAIRAATAHLDGVDGILGRALVTATYELTLTAFPGSIDLPLPPLASVTSIIYRDPAGASITLPSSSYRVAGVGGFGAVVPVASWPGTAAREDAVTVRFVAGYGNAMAVPEAIRQAAKAITGSLYLQREATYIGPASVRSVPEVARALLASFKVW